MHDAVGEVLALLAAVSSSAPSLTGPVEAQVPRLAELDWLSGTWLLERPGEFLEESWSAPAGNSMVGHFRWLRGGELWMSELLSITEEETGLVFRLRHFSASMSAWEEKDDAFAYRLTDHGPAYVPFTIMEPRPGRPTRFMFRALAADSLVVRFEADEGGATTSQEFRYGRAAGGPGHSGGRQTPCTSG